MLHRHSERQRPCPCVLRTLEGPRLDFTRLYAVYPSLEVGWLVVWSQVLVSVRRRRRRFYDRCPLKFFNPPLCAPFELPPSLFALRVHQIRQSGLVSLVSMTVNLLFMLFRNRAVPRRRALPFLLGCGSASARASSLLLFLRYVRHPCPCQPDSEKRGMWHGPCAAPPRSSLSSPAAGFSWMVQTRFGSLQWTFAWLWGCAQLPSELYH